MRFQVLSTVVVLAAAWGCGGNDPVNIGDDQRAKTGELLSDYAASWDGYAEAFTFKSGSDRVRIVLDDQGKGTVLLGDGPLVAPATDPEAWYSPVGEPQLFGDIGIPYQGLGEGFAYTIQHAAVQDKRIRFGIDADEVYKSWCELQTPVHNTAPEAPEYSCLPYAMSAGSYEGQCYVDDSVTGEQVPVSCAKLSICGGDNICTCTAEGCTVAPLAATDAKLHIVDAALDDGGDSLVGTFLINDRVTVRMERQ